MQKIAFIDSEIGGAKYNNIQDLGAILDNGSEFHSPRVSDFADFVAECPFLCGHNIVGHDLHFLAPHLHHPFKPIDTLPLSPLLFPRRQYHHLVKDDKLQSDELNNPLNDAKQARQLFLDEVNAFLALPPTLQSLYCTLLYPFPQFQGFFDYLSFSPTPVDCHLILSLFQGHLCSHANIAALMRTYPIELCYALALIGTHDHLSVTPPWVLHAFPKVENVMKYLRHTPCAEGCPYCRSRFDAHSALQRHFGFAQFRTYNGESLQQHAVEAAIEGESLLAIFPTGGGKSLTFQLPALIAGETIHGLTVVLSPLQSLMKDQVDNLDLQGIPGAVTVNGLLSPVERAHALRMVEDGTASMLYISPEQLRSATIQRLLLKRYIARFVIDEAHCFSSWGQDFRVDYLYIGEFLRQLQEQKSLSGQRQHIPVSCFTATAKQKVITDIKDHFQRTLGLDLKVFASTATRENLHYHVIHCDTELQKYTQLRYLLQSHSCPSIVYVARTKRSIELAEKLKHDGFSALPFNGRMERNEKVANQEAFMTDQVQVMVATSAFGMGVDKKDVGLVVHYDISDSLENYIQEAGRAGRDQSLQADCYVLFHDNDLDKHFILLNQSKISLSEIEQVWRAIKDLTHNRTRLCCSPLEIARQAGWDNSVSDVETRVKTAISALEQAGYIQRGRNVPHVFASSIVVKNMQEAVEAIKRSHLFSTEQNDNATRIIKSLISSRSRAEAGNAEAESRIDYLADILGIEKDKVVESVNLLRQAHVLSDMQDMSAFLQCSDSKNKSSLILSRFIKLEQFLLSHVGDGTTSLNLKEINEQALAASIPSASLRNIKTLLFYWHTKNLISRGEGSSDKQYLLVPLYSKEMLASKLSLRTEICRFVVESLYRHNAPMEDKAEVEVPFSLYGLWQSFVAQQQLTLGALPATQTDVEDALLYLSKIGALRLEGGFLVLYNAIEINRLERSNSIRYKKSDYRKLDEFYQQRMQQIHIVGEFANLMVSDYQAALQYVSDYFQKDYKAFIAQYFKGDRSADIQRNISPQRYHQLFDSLSPRQLDIINDNTSRHIVVAAGPGSGKTRILIHKLAALLQMEDVKHEQLLMLTFSRTAATEFKQRLRALIGNAANFVEIQPFPSFCFDLLGKIGTLEATSNVVRDAAQQIEQGEVEPCRITKTVLVLDEAQDMDADEYRLVQALMLRNEGMRVIAVGDDDQNIFAFRGSDSQHLRHLVAHHGATLYEMVDNYRSTPSIVALANNFVASIGQRLKIAPIQSAGHHPEGSLTITLHCGTNNEQPLIAQLMVHAFQGSTCVITSTNDEALLIASLLNWQGRPAKLIQTNDHFDLNNLAELRFFTLNLGTTPSSLSPEQWSNARQLLADNYSQSHCLPHCLHLIDTFADLYPKAYLSDFEEYLRESHFEDFYTLDTNTVFVSTIHKAKGREFDNVYLMLNDMGEIDDAKRRAYYVALTRAKTNLHIHTRANIFPYPHTTDTTLYPAPKEITLQLTHRDVVLSNFTHQQPEVLALRSGQSLLVKEGFLTDPNQPLLSIRLSKLCLSRLDTLKSQGYTPTAATIRFVVFWQEPDTPSPIAIPLPDLILQRQ